MADWGVSFIRYDAMPLPCADGGMFIMYDLGSIRHPTDVLSRVRRGMLPFITVTLASLMAGCIDAIVGGGGLIQLPAMLAAYPASAAATLFGTNKFASVWGTGWAAASFARRVRLPWHAIVPAVFAASSGAVLGAWLATRISDHWLRTLLPVILTAVLASTLSRKDLGRVHAPVYRGAAEAGAAAVISLAVGLYDGLFGPGTGSFLVFLFVRTLGYDFLHASGCAKVVNVATNLAALAIFVTGDHVWWPLAVAMAVANVAGSMVGTHMALRHGSGLVRGVFIGVVSLLILKTGYDACVSGR